MRILGVGHVCMIPACSNTKKLEQAQKRQKKREVDQCQSQSSSIAEVIPKIKLQLRSSLGLIHDKNKCLVLQTRISKAIVARA